MSQQNGGFPDGQQPWQGQESTSATPHVFPFGNQQQGEGGEAPEEPQHGSLPQAWNQEQVDQQWAQPQGQPPGGQSQQWDTP
ncbi:MAG TPA: hypothetical protein VK039_12850, partial [Brevibacterium sp.]|nr:hypothetical protein [Brevibacterium sp.]